MMGRPELDARLDDLRHALAQGMTHLVGSLVKAALIAGVSRQQLLQTAGYVGSGSGREAVRRALDQWSWIESRRSTVEKEIDSSPAFNGTGPAADHTMSFDGGSVTIRYPFR